MKLFTALKLFVLVLVLVEASARRYSSGSSRKSGGSTRGGSNKHHYGSPSRPHTQPSKPHQTASNAFIHEESRHPAAHNTNLHRNSNTQGPHTYNSGHRVQEHNQKNSATSVNSGRTEYNRQPSSNPHYTPSGAYSKLPSNGAFTPNGHNPPYPTGFANHPHPQPSHTPNLQSASSASHYPNVHPPASVSTYPNVHSQPPSAPTGFSYPTMHNSAGGYHPGSSYHPNGGGSYHPGSAPNFQAHPPPYAPTYHAPPPTQAFVPGRTVYVEKPSKGPGLGTYIASGVAGGVAAGATNAIVDHAISSIFRPSSNHIHTYPAAPVVGTPTETHTVNNYYYGKSGPDDSSSNNNGNNGNNYNNNGPSNSGPGNNEPNYNNNNNNNGPTNSDPNNYNNNNGQNQGFNGGAPYNQPSNSPQSQASPGVSNVATDNKGNPLSMTNGIVSRTPEAVAQAAADDPISDINIMKLTEELFEAQDKNLYTNIELNLQKRVTPSSTPSEKVPDEAPEKLFTLKSELDSIPTVTALRALYDNHERDGSKAENLTPEREREEDAFIDEIMKTTVMTKAMDWLAAQKYIEPRESEKKDTLRRMWFSTFDNTSSGFERIFLSERFGNDGIVGMQNWLYFAHLESQDKVNYLGYVDNANLSGKGQLLKLNYLTDGFTMQNATIFVGTPPELEVALYTICFYARPNNWCPVSLGGAKFFVLTHLFKYYQKDLIDLGFPAF